MRLTIATGLFAFLLFTPSAWSADVDVKEGIVYSKVDDVELRLDAYLPDGEELRPAVLVVHGGAWRMGNRKQLRGYANALAEKGFACFAIDYRLAPQHKFPAQIDDCRSAVKWIRSNAQEYRVDPERLGAIGYSAGGHLVTLLGTTGEAPSDDNGNVDTRIQAVAAGGAPTEFRSFPDNGKWADYLMGGDLDSVPEKFKAASATAFADENDAPTFFFNGNADRLVPLVWTQACFDELKKCGVRTEMYVVDGADHMAAARDSEALAKAYEFLDTELKSMDPSSAAVGSAAP